MRSLQSRFMGHLRHARYCHHNAAIGVLWYQRRMLTPIFIDTSHFILAPSADSIFLRS